MPTLLGDETAVVTGGASGIGRAIAHTFAENGADVVIADVRETPREGGEPTHETIEAESDVRARFVECDVTNRDHLEDAVETADAFGGIDVMVNNAGIYRKKPFLDVTPEEYDRMMNVHVRGTFFGSQAAAAAMIGNGDGSIVNMSSMAGIVGGGTVAAYCTAKGAIRLLTYSLAAEFGSDGIRANAIHPGFIETSMTTEIDDGGEDAADIPLRRVGQPEDVANVALFLASDLSGYVTGESILVDGGVVNTGDD